MVRLIHIADVKPVEIFLGRKTRGPITIRMTDEVIHRLLNSLDGPRDIYAIDPVTKKEVKLTNSNYLLPDDQLFGVVPVKKEETIKVDENAKLMVDTLKKQIEDMKADEASNTKSEEVTSEVDVHVPVSSEEPKMEESIENKEDKVDDVIKAEVTKDKTAEVKAAINNYNNNKGNYNKRNR